MKVNLDNIAYYSENISNTEKDHCERTIDLVKNIFEKHGFKAERNGPEYENEEIDYGYTIKFNGNDFTLVIQGSYGNGTCIKKESDVDIALILESQFKCKYGIFSKVDYGFYSASFDMAGFKKTLANWLREEGMAVTMHNKCIHVKGNGTSRKDFDLVPSIRYRDYTNDYSCDIENYIRGVVIETSDGKSVINYPELSRKENVDKNKTTNYMYKKIVRVFKNLRKEMQGEEQYIKNLSSYGIECLISNVPNKYFIKEDSESIVDVFIRVLSYLNYDKDNFNEYLETNKVLKIFDNKNNKEIDYKNFVEDIFIGVFLN